MTLELTTKFRGISTSPAARQRKGEEAHPLKRCYGALNYIARENASGIISWHGLRRPDGKPATTPKEARLALRRRFREEAAKGGKVGRRIATTGIVSLPNTWSEKTVRLAVERLARELAPEGSEASAIVIQHIDKSHNAHLHFLAVDGVESKDAAARRTDKRAAAQRVRRQNVQRFNERGGTETVAGSHCDNLEHDRKGIRGSGGRMAEFQRAWPETTGNPNTTVRRNGHRPKAADFRTR